MSSKTLPKVTNAFSPETFQNPAFKGKKGRVVIITALCVMVIATAALLLLYSPLFAARTIQIRGSRYLSKKQLLSIAQLSESTPLFDVNPGRMTTLLERNPWIQKATVSVFWPSKVVISVQETHPVGFLRLVNGSDVAVGSNGKVLPGSLSVSGLPQFIVPVKLSFQGASSKYLSVSLQNEALVINAMPTSLAGDVKSIDYLNASGVKLVLTNGTDVVFGNSFNLKEKWIALATIMAKTNINKDREIDLLDPNLPVVTQ